MNEPRKLSVFVGQGTYEELKALKDIRGSSMTDLVEEAVIQHLRKLPADEREMLDRLLSVFRYREGEPPKGTPDPWVVRVTGEEDLVVKWNPGSDAFLLVTEYHSEVAGRVEGITKYRHFRGRPDFIHVVNAAVPLVDTRILPDQGMKVMLHPDDWPVSEVLEIAPCLEGHLPPKEVPHTVRQASLVKEEAM